ncbi:MAG TPA: tetratricopeptide repeat protein [Candidatus Ozemobacteraceae bacterium]|nr:tetratricopeptide repeat protein [Candidatus Ozemobacteraceae bacterium]
MCWCRALTGTGLKLLLAVCITAASFSSGCGRKASETPAPTQQGIPGNIASGSAGQASGAAALGPAGGKNGVATGAGSLAALNGAPRKSSMTPAMRREFERRYEKGIELLEKEEYGEASRIFEQMLTESSDPQDASVAEYCLAEIYFRNKSNTRALEVFKQIVEKYPGTPAAENAKAGIEYLENFQKHEADYVSPEVEDRKRRGSGG